MPRPAHDRWDGRESLFPCSYLRPCNPSTPTPYHRRHSVFSRLPPRILAAAQLSPCSTPTTSPRASARPSPARRQSSVVGTLPGSNRCPGSRRLPLFAKDAPVQEDGYHHGRAPRPTTMFFSASSPRYSGSASATPCHRQPLELRPPPRAAVHFCSSSPPALQFGNRCNPDAASSVNLQYTIVQQSSTSSLPRLATSAVAVPRLELCRELWSFSASSPKVQLSGSE
jgi:hypothetical protein